jgi:hypothetical protein
MLKKISVLTAVLMTVFGCTPTAENQTGELKKDTATPLIVEVKELKDSIKEANELTLPLNDTLNAIANIMSGMTDTSSVYNFVQSSSDFKAFSKNFDKRWKTYDSTRLTNLRTFKENEISKVVKPQTTLFYPFSGPDILHAQTFFPEADKYVMIGLEPVGSLPKFKKEETDSLESYFQK